MGPTKEMRLILSELSLLQIKLRIKIVDLNFFEPLLTGIQFHKLCLPGTTIYNIPRKKYCVVNY